MHEVLEVGNLAPHPALRQRGGVGQVQERLDLVQRGGLDIERRGLAAPPVWVEWYGMWIYTSPSDESVHIYNHSSHDMYSLLELLQQLVARSGVVDRDEVVFAVGEEDLQGHVPQVVAPAVHHRDLVEW